MRFFSFILSLAIFLLSVSSSNAFAAACCGRSAAVPFLILGDEKAQLGMSVSGSQIVGQADQEHRFQSSQVNYRENLLTTQLNGAFLLNDRFQAGLSVPLVLKQVSQTVGTSQAFRVGDLRGSFAYEFLPVWSYSSWMPKGILFSAVSVPTGMSVYESLSPTRVDVTGNGFASVAFGVAFQKQWSEFDCFLMSEAHYSFSREFAKQGAAGETLLYHGTPGFGASTGIGMGYSPKAGSFRVGFRIFPRWDHLVDYRPASEPRAGLSDLVSRWTTDLGVDCSYMLNSDQTLTVSYTDQALIGPMQNSPLSRSIMVSFLHRWLR